MVTFNQLGLRSLSRDGVQSRTMNTSFANLCLFLNDFGTFNYFSLPMVNHPFLDPILPNSVMKNIFMTEYFHPLLLSFKSLVVVLIPIRYTIASLRIGSR
jgi:hypothetical protein